MVNKYIYITFFIFIINVCFGQEYDKNKYIKLSQLEFKEVVRKSKSLSGNYYITHLKKGELVGIDIKRYLNGKKTGEWLGFIKTIGIMDMASVCNYENNKLHGYFFITDNHTYYEEGYYEKGKKYGLWTKKVFFNKDFIETIKYNKNGKKHGKYTKIDFDSKEKEYISYKNGKRHGKYYLENKKDKKTIIGTYKNDLKHGVWVITDEYLLNIDRDGKIIPNIKKEHYKKGKLIKTE